MKIHSLHHAPFEGLGCIKDWIESKGYLLTSTNLYESDKLPGPQTFDMLVVMGGPMGVYDEDKYSWLKKEKLFIKNSIDEGKNVLGICLGSQLLAEILGAKVYRNKVTEIGWFPVTFSKEARDNPLFNFFPNELNVFHWHGDTYDIPAGAVHLGYSEGCRNQGFILKDKAAALQFHLEATPASIEEMIKGSEDELKKDTYTQTPDEILKMTSQCDANNAFMFEFLNRLEEAYYGESGR